MKLPYELREKIFKNCICMYIAYDYLIKVVDYSIYNIYKISIVLQRIKWDV